MGGNSRRVVPSDDQSRRARPLNGRCGLQVGMSIYELSSKERPATAMFSASQPSSNNNPSPRPTSQLPVAQSARPRSRQPTIAELLNNSVLDEIAANRSEPCSDPTERSPQPSRASDATLKSRNSATYAAAQSGLGTQQVELPEDPIEDLAARPATALRLAQEAFVQTGYWVAFYRAVLGAKGAVARLFPSRAEQRHFQESPECAEIYKILTALREQDNEKSSAIEPLKTITIRIPESLHERLATEAIDLETSLNKLCISKLLLPAPTEFVPKETRQPRGRKLQINCRDKSQSPQAKVESDA